METKINIATILKNKPKGTKLYSTVHGKCTFEAITDEIFKIKFCTSKFGLMQAGECTLIKFGNMFDDGECVIFPSKEMQDWSKFAWKKGDILVSRDKNIHLIFEKFIDDTYTIFVGKHCYEKNYRNEYNYERRFNGFKTEYFTLETEDAAQKYLKTIEEKLGGKLNRETLEIEKKTKFEDGDIAFADYGNRQYVFIVSGETGLSEGYNSSIYLDLSGPTPSTAFRTSFFKKNLCELRLATEEEKKQLFSALEEKGKRWDSDKKAIVDVKPKWTPKPFDKVLVRDSKSSKWRANLFSHKNIDEPYYCVYASWNYCIPYEGNEHLLGTTENVKE
ncbi:MAG: hypothetical protein [Bacteriophage sp.]|nr:MAG: hypothetical protein [Bacteriophage sp.]UVX67699.1 MAG: hypothetical protein [Bacteriophage sp.]